MKFARGLDRLQVKAAPLSLGAGAPAPGRGLASTWDLDRAIRDGVERCVWVFKAVRAISTDAAGLPVVVRDGHPITGPPIEDHFLLDLFNYRPNEWEDAFSFRTRLSMTTLLNKRGAFVELERDPAGRVARMTLLPPQRVRPIPDPKKFLAGFEVDLGSGRKRTLPPDRVLWVKYPHPTDPYSGTTPMEAAGISIEVDILSRIYNRSFLQNDGRPGGILAVDGEIEDEIMDELTARFAGGPGRAGRVVVMETDEGGATFVDTAITPRDAQHVETRKATKEDILIGFGTPESVLGNASGRTFDNADAEERGYWVHTQAGDHLPMLGSAFDILDGEPTHFVRFDTSDVEALQHSKRKAEERALEGWKAGALTLNEYRKAVGEPPLDTPEANMRYLPMGLVGTIADPAGQKTLGLPGNVDPDAIAAALLTRLEGKMGVPFQLSPPGVPSKSHPLPGSTDDPLRFQRKAADVRLSRHERSLYLEVKRFFDRQEKVVKAKLTGTKARKGTRYWDPPPLEAKALAIGDIFDLAKWKTEMADLVTPWLESLYEEVVVEVVEAVTDDGTKALPEEGFVFNLQDPQVSAEIAARTNRLVGTVDTTWKAVQRGLVDGEVAGESIQQLSARIGSVFSQARGLRARTIARTEVVSAVNSASVIGAQKSGVVGKKKWLTAVDHRTREAHAFADGQTVELDEKFTVAGEQLAYPGDPAASAANVINCRCTVLYERNADPEGLEDGTQPELLDPTPHADADKVRPVSNDQMGSSSRNVAKTVDKSQKSTTPLGPKSKVAKGVKDGLDAIDGVHGSPGLVDGLRLFQSTGDRTLGGFGYGRADGAARYIKVSSRGDSQAFAFTHEMGHYLDNEDFFSPVGYESRRHAPRLSMRDGTYTPSEADDGEVEGSAQAWGSFWNSVNDSDAMVRLRDIRSGKLPHPTLDDGSVIRWDTGHVRYLMEPFEVFARAYSQWIAVESQSTALLRGLDRFREGFYPAQWADDDFEPIARALRSLFRTYGMVE